MKHRRPEGSRPRRAVFESSFFVALIAVPLFTAAALAQSDDIYPAKGQSQAQQDRDRYECHSWAVKQTGFDPSRPPQTAMPAAPKPNTYASNTYQPSQRHVLRVRVVERRSER
jgi:hypothetical protein